MTGTSRALGEPYRKQPGDERRTGYFSLNTSPSCASKAESEENDEHGESAGRLRRERRTLQRPGIRHLGLERIPAEAAAVRQQRSKVVTREQVHSRPFSERAGVFLRDKPGRRTACLHERPFARSLEAGCAKSSPPGTENTTKSQRREKKNEDLRRTDSPRPDCPGDR